MRTLLPLTCKFMEMSQNFRNLKGVKRSLTCSCSPKHTQTHSVCWETKQREASWRKSHVFAVSLLSSSPGLVETCLRQEEPEEDMGVSSGLTTVAATLSCCHFHINHNRLSAASQRLTGTQSTLLKKSTLEGDLMVFSC